MDSPTVLEARSPKPRCLPGHTPPEESRGEAFFTLPPSGGSSCSLTCGHTLLSLSAHGLLLSIPSPPPHPLCCVSYKDAWLVFRTHLGSLGYSAYSGVILNYMCKDHFSQIRSTDSSSMWAYLWGGHSSGHYRGSAHLTPAQPQVQDPESWTPSYRSLWGLTSELQHPYLPNRDLKG